MLRGALHGLSADRLRLELFQEEGGPTLEYAAAADGDGFSVRIPAADLRTGGDEEALGGDAEDEDTEQGVRWQLMLLAGRRRDKVWLAQDAPVAAWPTEGAEVALHRSFTGHAALVVRAPEPVLTSAEWTPEGALRVTGLRGAWTHPMELVLHGPQSGAQHAFAATDTGDGGFAGELAPAAIETLGGRVALRQGAWHLCARPIGARTESDLAPLVVARELLRELPRARWSRTRPSRSARWRATAPC